jgi:hypothetical protein
MSLLCLVIRLGLWGCGADAGRAGGTGAETDADTGTGAHRIRYSYDS